MNRIRMGTFVLVLLMTCGLAVQALAFGGKSFDAQGASQKIVSQMVERLSLSTEQEGAVRPIIENSLKEQQRMLQEFRNQGTRDRSALKREMEEQRARVNAQLEHVLTPEQISEWQKMKAEQREKHGTPGGGFRRSRY